MAILIWCAKSAHPPDPNRVIWSTKKRGGGGNCPSCPPLRRSIPDNVWFSEFRSSTVVYYTTMLLRNSLTHTLPFLFRTEQNWITLHHCVLVRCALLEFATCLFIIILMGNFAHCKNWRLVFQCFLHILLLFLTEQKCIKMHHCVLVRCAWLEFATCLFIIILLGNCAHCENWRHNKKTA